MKFCVAFWSMILVWNIMKCRCIVQLWTIAVFRDVYWNVSKLVSAKLLQSWFLSNLNRQSEFRDKEDGVSSLQVPRGSCRKWSGICNKYISAVIQSCSYIWILKNRVQKIHLGSPGTLSLVFVDSRSYSSSSRRVINNADYKSCNVTEIWIHLVSMLCGYDRHRVDSRSCYLELICRDLSSMLNCFSKAWLKFN